LNFSLTKEQSALRVAARTLTQTLIAPGEPHRGQEFHEIIRSLTAHGLMGMTVPGKYGGGGRDEVSHVLTIMEVSRKSASAGGLLVWNNSLFCLSVLRYGSEEQKRKYLSLSLSGEKPGCFVLLGSDTPRDIRIRLVAEGGDWRIRGEGCFFPCGIPLGIVAALSPERNSVSFIIIDLENSADLRRGETFERGGVFLSGIAETIFENARITSDAVLSSGDDGTNPIQSALLESWLGLGALAAGIGRGTLDDVLDFARNERGSGRVSQVAEWKLADMGVELDASELLVMKAAWLKDHGKQYEKEAAAAKAFAAEVALRGSFEGLQILGNSDPGRRISIKKRMRDAEMCQVYYGTREKLDFVVAEHLGRGKITDS
jgi:alkylation response protein AidB-like acyl-CoA dehydrogenase